MDYTNNQLQNHREGGWSASRSRTALGVDLRHPVMTLRALRCTTSRCSRFDGALPVIHPAAVYSAHDRKEAM